MSHQQAMEFQQKFVHTGITYSHIIDSIDEMADNMNDDFDRSELSQIVGLTVLKGGIPFAGHLFPKLTFPIQLDYINATRYGNEQQGDATVRLLAEPTVSLENKIVILFDDILDEGVTLEYIIQYCNQHGALKVYTAVLFDKTGKAADRNLKRADYTGMAIQNDFVVGFGLDVEGYWRNLPYLVKLS